MSVCVTYLLPYACCSQMLVCSRCKERQPRSSFTAKQLKAGSKRFCKGCTNGAGTLNAFFQVAPSAEDVRPSQTVHEVQSVTPNKGERLRITMERLSTGGTRHTAQVEVAGDGPMSGSERMAKARARLSLFPERQLGEREKHAAREAMRRAATQQVICLECERAAINRRMQSYHHARLRVCACVPRSV